MKVRFSPEASGDLLDAFDYIARESRSSAIAVSSRVRNTARRLTDTPYIGRPGRLEGTRELVVRRTPYILVYRIQIDYVRILRVLHSQRNWPPA